MKKNIVSRSVLSLSLVLALGVSLSTGYTCDGNSVALAAESLSASQIIEKGVEETQKLLHVHSAETIKAVIVDPEVLEGFSGGKTPTIADLISIESKKETVESELIEDINRDNGVNKIYTKTTMDGKTEEETTYIDKTKIYSNDDGKWFFTPLEDTVESANIPSDLTSDPRAIAESIINDQKAVATIEGIEKVSIKDTADPDKMVDCYKVVVKDFNLMDTFVSVLGDSIGGTAVSLGKKLEALSTITYYIGADDYILYKSISDIDISAKASAVLDYLGLNIDLGSNDYDVKIADIYIEDYNDITAPAIELPSEVAAAKIVAGYSTEDKNFEYSTVYESGKPVIRVRSLKKNSKNVSVPASVKILDKKYSVTRVDSSAFAKGTKTTKITLPKSVTKVGKNAFKKCKKLKTVVVKNKKLRKTLKSKKGRKSAGIRTKAKVK